jgi:hypothetical protein
MVSRARKLAHLPVTAGAWRAGTLSSGQVEAIAAHLDPDTLDLFAHHETDMVPTLVGLPVPDVAAAMGAWLDRLRIELADVDHQAHILAGATAVYLETLAERGDPLAGFLARQAEALFGRRACVAMEIHHMRPTWGRHPVGGGTRSRNVKPSEVAPDPRAGQPAEARWTTQEDRHRARPARQPGTRGPRSKSSSEHTPVLKGGHVPVSIERAKALLAEAQAIVAGAKAAGRPMTAVERRHGLTLEDWAELYGVPDHVWWNLCRHHADEEPG